MVNPIQVQQEVTQSIEGIMENVRNTMNAYAERVVEFTEANIIATIYGVFTTEKQRASTLKSVKESRKSEWSKALKKANGDNKLALEYYCS